MIRWQINYVTRRWCAVYDICRLQTRGVTRGGPGVLVTPPWKAFFWANNLHIQVAKTPWQYLGRKSHCWKAHFFKICFFVNYFHQRLLSLVNMGLRAAVIRLSPVIHEGEQRVSSLSDPPFEKSWLRPCRLQTADCSLQMSYTAFNTNISVYENISPYTTNKK